MESRKADDILAPIFRYVSKVLVHGAVLADEDVRQPYSPQKKPARPFSEQPGLNQLNLYIAAYFAVITPFSCNKSINAAVAACPPAGFG